MIGGNMKGSRDREERPDRSARTLSLHVHKGPSMSLPNENMPQKQLKKTFTLT